MNGKAAKQAKRSLPEAMRKHCFKPGQSGNPEGSAAALERTREGGAILDKYRTMTPPQLRALDLGKIPIQEGIIIRRILAAFDNEGDARSKMIERLLGTMPQALTGPDNAPLFPPGAPGAYIVVGAEGTEGGE